jgi:hypothetical protein
MSVESWAVHVGYRKREGEGGGGECWVTNRWVGSEVRGGEEVKGEKIRGVSWNEG